LDFSLKVYLDNLDKYPENKIMNVIMEQYELPLKGVLFNPKFILETEMLMLGYVGFKALLYVILETDETFLNSCLNELRAITLTLSGDFG